MALSNSFTFTVNANDIVREAMLNIGKLGEGATPSAQEYTDCLRKLNALCKQWMGRQDFAPGLKMWKRRHGDLWMSSITGQYLVGPGGNWTSGGYLQVQTTAAAAALATQIFLPTSGGLSTTGATTNIAIGDSIGIQLANGSLFWTTVASLIAGPPTGVNLTVAIPSAMGSGAYVFDYTTPGQRPLYLETCLLRDVNSNDIPMNLLTVQEYDLLSSKTQIGFASDPTSVYYEAQLTNGVLYIDCAAAQDVTKHLHMTFMEPIQDFVNPTDNPDYPQEWYMALCWGLTLQIAPMFNLPFTADMKQNFTSALAMAQEANGETTALFFQPYNDGRA